MRFGVKRVIKKAFLPLLILIIASISALYIKYALFPIVQQTDFVYLQNANLSFTQYNVSHKTEQCLNALLKNHQATQSTGVVLGKKYYNYDKRYTDSGVFEILSVSFKKPLEKKTYFWQHNEFQIYFSKGSWHWMHHCSGLFSNSGQGKITLLNITDEQIKAAFDLELIALSAQNNTDQEQVKIKETYIFQRANMEPWNAYLSQWDGVFLPSNGPNTAVK